MNFFSPDIDQLLTRSKRAQERAGLGAGASMLQDLKDGNSLSDDALCTLLFCQTATAENLLSVAGILNPNRINEVETFAPLYISNECDGECKMCGMRRGNQKLKRKTADSLTIHEQLDILCGRHMRGVAILAGEYRHGPRRKKMLERAAEAMRYAIEAEFSHILINVGSLEEYEYGDFFAGVPRDPAGLIKPHITMCTFQETYDPSVYRRFMGNSSENPRADFSRRLSNFSRSQEAGVRSVNPGVLLGLNRDLGFEFLALSAHIRYLESLDLKVYVSVPRLRKASGAERQNGLTDDELIRFVSLLSLQFPKARVVISTRERPEIQRRLMPIIGVLTPGSPGVAPYSSQSARFEIEASQFEVLDQRPFERILGEYLENGILIDGYNPDAR